MDMAHQFRELPFVGHVIPAESPKSNAEEKA